MNEFGLKIASRVPNGTVIALLGDLGAGKTTLVRGVARGLGIKEVVQSPTFNIMKLYPKGDRPLIHIDAYRLADINTDIGLDEYIGYETGITMIEWPLFIEKLLPENTLWINITSTGENSRHIDVYSSDDKLVEGLK
jgi:tRNA threonylcarbamoyladenosine biosynthesis protein TsaE